MTTVPATARPPLDRKHTKSSEAKRQENLNLGARITVNGEAFEARLGDITPVFGREVRRALGYGFMDLLDRLGDSPELDYVAEFLWVARRLRGEDVALDDIELDYADLLDEGFDVGDPAALPAIEEDGVNPEA